MEDSLKRRGINKNNLLPWFLQDHGTLPASYLKSCQKFFDGLGGRVGPKATSSQAKIKVDKQKSNIYKYGKL